MKKKFINILCLLASSFIFANVMVFLSSCTINSSTKQEVLPSPENKPNNPGGDSIVPPPSTDKENQDNNNVIPPSNNNNNNNENNNNTGKPEVKPDNNNNGDNNIQRPENKPDDNQQSLFLKEFDKISGNGMIRSQYQTSSYIKSRYKRTPASTYSNNDLKEMWGENAFNIDDFPHPNNPKRLNFSRQRYEEVIKRYSSSFEKLPNNKYPMMNFLTIDELIKNNSLKKHPVADYQYEYQNRVSDDTLAVEKALNIDLNEYGYISTGLYLPPGEMIEISIDNLSDEELSGQEYYLMLSLGKNESSNVEKHHLGDDYDQGSRWWQYRMPSMSTAIRLTKNKFKYGTPFGGLVHIRNITEASKVSKKNISMTIKGAIETISYVHGKTTQEEWYDQIKRYKNSSDPNKITAPIFDFSTDNIKFYGPTHELYLKTYNNNSYPQTSMDWWDNHAISSYDLIDKYNQNNKTQPIIITYSNFVPFGLAVAIVGSHYSVLPLTATKSILDYNNLIKTTDSWITLHEFNHHNQESKWAFELWKETSNNALSLFSLVQNSNFYSDRGFFEDVNNISEGHLYKILSINQIKKAVKLGEEAGNSSENRAGFDVDYAILFSQFGPSAFRNYIKSFYNEEYAKDYLGNKFTVPLEMKDGYNNIMTQHGELIYIMSLITGYDWSDYAEFTKLIKPSEKGLIKATLKSKYKNIKKMIPAGSFYGNKIKYGSDKKDWEISATPFYLKTLFSDGYLFKNSALAYVPTKSNGTTFATIENLKILETTKYGTLTKESNGYRYKLNNGLDKSKIDLDNFTYSFDVKDNEGNVNTVSFNVDIHLKEPTGVNLNSNEEFLKINSIGPSSNKLGINGSWTKLKNGGKFNNETIKSIDNNSEIGFNFKGNSFEIYGLISNEHGDYNVYVDGKLIENIFKQSNNTNKIQKVFGYTFNDNKPHNVVVKPKNSKPIEISHFNFNGEIMDISLKK